MFINTGTDIYRFVPHLYPMCWMIQLQPLDGSLLKSALCSALTLAVSVNSVQQKERISCNIEHRSILFQYELPQTSDSDSDCTTDNKHLHFDFKIDEEGSV